MAKEAYDEIYCQYAPVLRYCDGAFRLKRSTEVRQPL